MSRSFRVESCWRANEQSLARSLQSAQTAVEFQKRKVRGLPVTLDGELIGVAHHFEPGGATREGDDVKLGEDGFMCDGHIRFDVDLSQDLENEGYTFEPDNNDRPTAICAVKIEEARWPRRRSRAMEAAHQAREQQRRIRKLEEENASLRAERKTDDQGGKGGDSGDQPSPWGVA